MRTSAFDRFGGWAAVLAGIVGLAYSVSFVLLKNPLLCSVFLMLGGVLSSAALVALFSHLEEVDRSFARLGLALALAGALGAAVHGAYDLANAINPPAASAAALADLPNQVDPRGFLTFGVAGLALFFAAYLLGRHAGSQSGFVLLTYVLATLLLIVYLGRLIVLNPASPLVLLPAAVTGFLVNPIWYIWLGLALERGRVGAVAATARA
jgi:hypothetical protein